MLLLKAVTVCRGVWTPKGKLLQMLPPETSSEVPVLPRSPACFGVFPPAGLSWSVCACHSWTEQTTVALTLSVTADRALAATLESLLQLVSWSKDSVLSRTV